MAGCSVAGGRQGGGRTVGAWSSPLLTTIRGRTGWRRRLADRRWRADQLLGRPRREAWRHRCRATPRIYPRAPQGSHCPPVSRSMN